VNTCSYIGDAAHNMETCVCVSLTWNALAGGNEACQCSAVETHHSSLINIYRD